MSWQRRYPPLLVIGGPLIVAGCALTSALNLPQANPGQTLEYAPVPGNANQSSQQGNLAGLGLGSGGEALGSGGIPPDLGPLGPLLPGAPGNPSNKRCVGIPPRQTEDPLSPPCVGSYTGNNGGATYTGVTKDEVVLLYYLDGNGTDYGTSQGNQPIPTSKYVDMAKPVDPNDGVWSQMLHLAQTYFNARFQTYNRKVHIWAYFDSGATSADASPQQRRQDAADNWNQLHPFAVISYPIFDSQDYLSAMASHGVASFVGSKMFNYGSLGAPAGYFRTV